MLWDSVLGIGRVAVKTNKQTAIQTNKQQQKNKPKLDPAFLELTFCFQSGRIGESASHRGLDLPCKANQRAPTLTEPPKFCFSLLRTSGLLATPSVLHGLDYLHL